MAETDIATPGTGATGTDDSQIFGVIAAQVVDAKDAEAGQPPREPDKDGEPEGAPNKVVEGEDAPATLEEAPEESDAGEQQQLPDTAKELAEALGVSFADLSKMRVPITLDGQEIEVTLHEALQGHQREADYTRKTTDVSEFRKNTEALAHSLASEKQHHYESMASLFNEVGIAIVGNPPPKSLLDENSQDYDPNKYTALKEDHNERVKWFNEAQNKVKESRRQLSASEAQKMQGYAVQQASAFRSLNPEWADDAKFTAAQGDIVTYLKGKGYPDERIATVIDAQDAMIVWNSMMYEKAKAQIGNSKQKPVPSFQRRGSAPIFPNQSKRRALNAAVTRLAKGDHSREAQVDAFRKFVG